MSEYNDGLEAATQLAESAHGVMAGRGIAAAIRALKRPTHKFVHSKSPAPPAAEPPTFALMGKYACGFTNDGRHCLGCGGSMELCGTPLSKCPYGDPNEREKVAELLASIAAERARADGWEEIADQRMVSCDRKHKKLLAAEARAVELERALEEAREELFRLGQDSASAYEHGDGLSRHQADNAAKEIHDRIDAALRRPDV